MKWTGLIVGACLSLTEALPHDQPWGHAPWHYGNEPAGYGPAKGQHGPSTPAAPVTAWSYGSPIWHSASGCKAPPPPTGYATTSAASPAKTSSATSTAKPSSSSAGVPSYGGSSSTSSSHASVVPYSSSSATKVSTSSSSVSQSKAAIGTSLSISNGGLIGTTTTQVDGTTTATVTKFLGIPFASNPPVRFAAPEAAQPWSTPLSVTDFAPGCIAANGSFLGLTPRAQSESCLYLNVFVPPGTSADAKLPVMSWIYGGNLAFGDAGTPFYDGSSFAANQKVVLVTSNYRTNIFGFSMSPDIPVEQRNAGFLDQRLALQWIQQNIASFGGDPQKVTIFGESAGGYSVEQLISYPTTPPLFRGAIMESRGFGGPTSGNLTWFNALGAANCYLSSDQLGCMRSKDAIVLENAIQNLTFGPVPDGVTFASDIRPRIAANQVANIPIFIGTNGNEGSVLTSFGGFSADVITNYEFTCLTSLFSQALSNSSRPTWRYLYNASFPNTTPFPGAGAFHSSEIPEVFGTYPRAGATDQQIALSKFMQTAWANYAKDPVSGPGPQWPLVSTGNLFLLGNDTSTSGFAYPASTIDAPCPGYYALINQVGY